MNLLTYDAAMATATETRRVVLTREYMKQHMARGVPDAWFDRDADGGPAWVVDDPTPRSAAVILRLFPEARRDYPWLEELRDELNHDVRPFDNATPFNQRITQHISSDFYAALKHADIELYDFQNIDLGYLYHVLQKHGAAYLGWERGLGKTLGTAAVIDALDVYAGLVVAPNTAKAPVWGSELARFLPHYKVIVMRNSKAHREKDMARAQGYIAAGTRFIFVVHYEALDIIWKQSRNNAFTRHEWDIVAADEVHRTKNPTAKMTRALKRIPTKMKLALSGSIIMNHAEELFSPAQWLFPTIYRSKWRDWNDRYLEYIEGGYGKVCIGVKPDRVDAMRRELGVFMVYRRKEDELDLPQKTEQTLLVDLGAAQRKAYDELLGSMLTRLDDGSIVAATDGLVLLGRLRQVATGLDLFTDDVRDSSKLDLALELIEDSEDEAFVVFGWYKASLRALAARLEARGIECFLVDGDVPQQRRDEYIGRFQAGERRVFLGTLSTLGESVNLQRASNAIFLDRSWNPGTNVQAQDRIYRMGQKNKVTITHIVARDTVDELRVLPTIANKEALRRLILGGN